MSFERVSPGPEPGATPGPAESSSGRGIQASLRLQILATEHWSLLASRSLAWNETFTRAGMFLSTLTGSVVALGLVAAFGEAFRTFALLILPIVLFIGITTYLRIGVSNYHDALCVIGMNRIRAAYLEIAPDVERYFVMSAHDDLRGVGISMGVPPGGSGIPMVHFLSATPTVVAVVNSVLAGVIVALVALQAGSGTVLPTALGVIAFVVAFVTHIVYVRRVLARTMASHRPLFPGTEGD
jgi:hypothetical protein